MLGGGPEIRAHTYKVFHKRDHRKVFEEVLTWLRSEITMLGCTPCIPTIGIGRTHFEASSLMLKAMAYGNLNNQSELEKALTESLNNTNIGALGIGGSVTALGSFVKYWTSKGQWRENSLYTSLLLCGTKEIICTTCLPNFWSDF